MSTDSPMIRTVRGDIEPSQLGICYRMLCEPSPLSGCLRLDTVVKL
jgi:hypothetical protein